MESSRSEVIPAARGEAPLLGSEKAKMLAGELYDPLDPLLKSERMRARILCRELNELRAEQAVERATLLRDLFGYETDAWIEPPFQCDYGTNLVLGSKVYFNFNCLVLDVMPVEIGENVLIGPGVHIYTAMHPTSSVQRKVGLEYARPVSIGPDVWIGGGVIICPGVKIGAASVIGAGSVVTGDIPAGVFAAGNPCRVIRPLEAVA